MILKKKRLRAINLSPYRDIIKKSALNILQIDVDVI